MVWNSIESVSQIDDILHDSFKFPQVIFKHSTSCSISYMAKMRLDDGNAAFKEKFQFHYLDLLRFRNISNEIAERLDVYHESPQVILLHKGEVIYDASHFDISPEELLETHEFHFSSLGH